MGGAVLIFVIVLAIIFLFSLLSGDERNGKGHGRGKNGHGKGHGNQPDPSDPTGQGHGQPPHGAHTGGGKPVKGQPASTSSRGGSSSAQQPTYRPPRVIPAFDTPAQREAYCRDLEAQGCRVDRRAGTVSLPGESSSSGILGTLTLPITLGLSLLLYIRIYGSPLVVILEFIRVMTEKH